MEKIPFFDLKLQYQQIEAEVKAQIESVLDSMAFVDGKFVHEFECEFAGYCDSKYALGVNSGTSALEIAVAAYGIGPGDEVIVPANTFVATAMAVSYTGATPVFVDCCPDTWNIDHEDVARKITDKTKAVMGVHLYGQAFDADPLIELCEAHNLKLIEDAAQAHGATYKGRKVGNIGDVACFSFYPSKNLGAYGQGGALVTNDLAVYEKSKSLRLYGAAKRYYFDELGFNMRMDGFQAAILNVKLKYLDQWNTRRKEIAQQYQQGIQNPLLHMQHQPEWSDAVYHLFVITTDSRERMTNFLNDHNIFPAVHYPVPCHLQRAYENLGYKRGDLPHSEHLADHCVSLPMFAEMTDAQVQRVIEVVNMYR